MRGIMRITNKIMQRNNLSNINTNKVNEDRLSTQMSTEKKINRPSDDPVVAIRALRLRSGVTEVSITARTSLTRRAGSTSHRMR